MIKKMIVVGLGSMGKRRIRLLKQIDKDIKIIGVDSLAERCKEAKLLFAIDTCQDLDKVLQKDYTCVFICTSPLSHAKLITKCLEYNLHVFTEINLVADGYIENITIAKQKGLLLFLSSTHLYREEIRYIKKEVRSANSLLSYSYHIGQYLPDWHPWENYTDYFIGNNRTNGCREIMAIELPWLYKTFGKVIDVNIKKNKKTTLKTEYNDSYLLLLEHEQGVQGTLIIDVVSRKAVRNLEIYGEDLYLSWDGTVNGLKKYNIDSKMEEIIHLYQKVDRQKEYAEFVVENAYRNEIIAFFEAIETGKRAEYGFEEDREILSLIDMIEGI